LRRRCCRPLKTAPEARGAGPFALASRRQRMNAIRNFCSESGPFIKTSWQLPLISLEEETLLPVVGKHYTNHKQWEKQHGIEVRGGPESVQACAGLYQPA
jgi:hypothetical protein